MSAEEKDTADQMGMSYEKYASYQLQHLAEKKKGTIR